MARIPGGRAYRRGRAGDVEINKEEALEARRRAGDLDLKFQRLETLSYEDLKFPAQGINPPGAASDPTRNTTTGLLHFSGTADNIITGVAQFPHGWYEGSSVNPHLHLTFPTSASANSRWQFEYSRANINGDFEGAYGTYPNSLIVTVPNPQNTVKHAYASLGDIDMTGYTFSCIMMWKITRLASSDPLDNDTNAIALLEFDLHYLNYRFGHNFDTTPNIRA